MLKRVFQRNPETAKFAGTFQEKEEKMVLENNQNDKNVPVFQNVPDSWNTRIAVQQRDRGMVFQCSSKRQVNFKNSHLAMSC